MTLEYSVDFPPSPKWRSYAADIHGRYFFVTIHEITPRNFEFIVKSMPKCPARPYNDIVTNTFVRDDLRLIAFSRELMPEDWPSALVFVSDWAHAIVRYIDQGHRFYLSRASDELDPGNGETC